MFCIDVSNDANANRTEDEMNNEKMITEEQAKIFSEFFSNLPDAEKEKYVRLYAKHGDAFVRFVWETLTK